VPYFKISLKMAMNIPWNLLKKFVQGEIAETELRELEIWRTSSELNHNIFSEITEDQDFKKNLISGCWESNSDEWGKVLAKIKPSVKLVKFSRNSLYLVASTAAAIILFLGISVGLWYGKMRQGGVYNKSGYSYIFSPKGQRTQVILPDRTKVWLNAESSLRYAADFNQQKREVYLEGEGFFEVTKNSSKPFLVNAREIKVKVYGTTFNLKAFPDDKYIETTLIEGKLSVIPTGNKKSSAREVFLNPNEKCIFEKTSKNVGIEGIENKESSQGNNVQVPSGLKDRSKPHIILVKNINPEAEMGWKEGKLLFKNETFGELAIKLERWYDMHIHFEDERIRNYRFTGVFDKETINQAMEALRISSQKSYQYEIIYRDIYLK
jgi:transmembrane sensor